MKEITQRLESHKMIDFAETILKSITFIQEGKSKFNNYRFDFKGKHAKSVNLGLWIRESCG